MFIFSLYILMKLGLYYYTNKFWSELYRDSTLIFMLTHLLYTTVLTKNKPSDIIITHLTSLQDIPRD